MVNNFMTKKEFDRIIFSQRHKKDYGPKYLRIPSVLGAILLVCLFFWRKCLFAVNGRVLEKRAYRQTGMDFIIHSIYSLFRCGYSFYH